MVSSITDTRKSRGRPRVNATQLAVRVPPDDLAKLDAWIAAQPEPRPSRPEALRRLASEALTRPVERQHQSDASLDRQIAEQETAIAEIPEHSEPSPEAGMAAMDRAVAENDLTDMKNKRTRRKSASLK